MKFTQIFTLAALALSSVVEGGVLPRQTAPDFKNVNSLQDESFKGVSLSDYKGKYVVLVFYPFDFTYVCPTELISFSENI